MSAKKLHVEIGLCPDCGEVHLEVKVGREVILDAPISDSKWDEIFLAVARKQRERDGALSS